MEDRPARCSLQPGCPVKPCVRLAALLGAMTGRGLQAFAPGGSRQVGGLHRAGRVLHRFLGDDRPNPHLDRSWWELELGTGRSYPSLSPDSHLPSPLSRSTGAAVSSMKAKRSAG